MVVEGYDARTERRVAVKLLLKGRGADEASRRRFLREGRSLAKLRHPHVVCVHDAGEEHGVPYLVLDLVEGGSLQERLDRAGPLPPAEVAAIGRDLAGALAAAHAVGVLHRDLKPENVLAEVGGRVLLTDFGLAKDLDRLGETQRLTQSGVYMGTPGFWSPEQASGHPERIGVPSDVYGLGATLYALLTARAPVDAESFLALVVATQQDPPAPLPASVPKGLQAVVMTCLAKDPTERYPSAALLAADLARICSSEAPQHASGEVPGAARRRLLAGGLVLGVLGLGGALAFALAPGAPDPTATGSPRLSASSAPQSTSPSTPSPSPSRDLRQLWRRYRERLEAGDLVAAGAALRAAHEGGSREALAALGTGWVEVRLVGPLGVQIELSFIEGPRPCLVLTQPGVLTVWDLHDVLSGQERIDSYSNGPISLAAETPRLAATEGAELVIRELSSGSPEVGRFPLILDDWDVLRLGPAGRRAAYLSKGRLHLVDFSDPTAPSARSAELPLGRKPDLVFIDRETLLICAQGVEAEAPGWFARVDLSAESLRIEAIPFAQVGDEGNPGWLLPPSGGAVGVIARTYQHLQWIPRAGEPVLLALPPHDGAREGPPFAFSGTGPAPVLLALLRPEPPLTPLEVWEVDHGALRPRRAQPVASYSDAVAISASQELLAVGDSVQGSVSIYLSGGPAALTGR